MKVILLNAISIDGKIARHSGEEVDWTTSEDKRRFAQVSRKAGVVIIGHSSFKVLKKPLSGRLMIVLTRKTQGKKNISGVVEFTNQSPKKILEDLVKRGFKTVIVAGGSQINALFLKDKLIDEIWLTLVPRIFGRGISLFGEKSLDYRLCLVSFDKLDQDTLLLKYKVNY